MPSTNEERLDQLRLKLLDLTTNNRMLSYRHPRGACLRVIDELPDVIFGRLIKEQSLTFGAVPEPMENELKRWAHDPTSVPNAHERPVLQKPDALTWARRLGFTATYELPVVADDFERLERHQDNKLQTPFYQDDLDLRLRKIATLAQTAIEESGANMLFLSFGFLEWQDTASARAHQAPLLLMPVQLKQNRKAKGRHTFELQWTGEEVQINLSLRKKLEQFNLELPDFDENTNVESYFTTSTHAIATKSNWQIRRYITLGLFEFGKINIYLDTDPRCWPKDNPITNRPLVRIALQGVGGKNQAEGGLIRGEYSPVESQRAAQFRDLELPLVDRADSSQCAALEAALSGQNLVIEGPPGTGKSQTITNLIAAALFQGKTVLFVAEKLAALQVVRRRMRELGLGEFCLELHSHKTRKTQALEDIAERLKLSISPAIPTDAAKRLSEKREELGQYLYIVGARAGNLDNVTIADVLMQAGHAKRLLGAAYSVVRASGVKVSNPETLSFSDYVSARSRLIAFSKAYQTLGVSGGAHNHPWAGVSASRVFSSDSDELSGLAEIWAEAASKLEQGIEAAGFLQTEVVDGYGEYVAILRNLSTIEPAAAAAEEISSLVEQLFGVRVPRTAEAADWVSRIPLLIDEAPLSQLGVVPPAVTSGEALDSLLTLSQKLAALAEQKRQLQTQFREEGFAARHDDLEDCAIVFAERGWFRRWTKRWREASSQWATFTRPAARSFKPRQRADSLNALRSFKQDLESLRKGVEVLILTGDPAIEPEADLSAHLQAARWAEAVRAQLPIQLAEALVAASPDVLRTVVNRARASDQAALTTIAATGVTESASTYWENVVKAFVPPHLVQETMDAAASRRLNDLIQGAGVCADREADYLRASAEFIERSGLDMSRWLAGCQAGSLSEISQRSRKAAARPDDLHTWLEYSRVESGFVGKPEQEIAQAVATGRLSADRIELVLDCVFFDALAREAFVSAPHLRRFSGQTLDKLREDYKSLDAQVMELRRAEVARKLSNVKPPEGVSSGLVAQLTEKALLRHEIQKQKKHLALRQLMARAGKAIQALKPCFMMGPFSVAQYLPPESLKFDLIVMDEASQMKPEDAIGALARGGQAIIVGDSKQLPPTSFFERVILDGKDDSDDDGALVAATAQSVLEFAASMLTSHMLKWHYRSRHESLIAFSNREFYDGELIVFPSPGKQSGRFGIVWTFVGNGVFDKGVNPEEARVVARAAARILVEQRGRSLGVVAMNVKQVERIADELNALAAKDPAIADALFVAESLSSEPFFVKNLENVQGDERDIIMISMTYGPSASGGKVAQRFGPINHDTGWRRLNVLFTRAKERMEVISSMRSSDVIPNEGEDRGPRSLKLFLDYAETGRLGADPTVTGRPTGSPFEDAVLEGLKSLGYVCEPQVGVANFYLDIAVRDPANPGEFIAAVECDGAAYHSTLSARDRDRLRQEILENLGWSVLRVWSTDWFQNPGAELQRLSSELQKLIAASRHKQSQPLQRAPEAQERETINEQVALHPVGTNGAAKVGRISAEEARSMLVDLREGEIRQRYPNSDRNRSLLRKRMLDELIKKRPVDLQDFHRLISAELREATDGEQLKSYHEKVFEILEKIA